MQEPLDLTEWQVEEEAERQCGFDGTSKYFRCPGDTHSVTSPRPTRLDRERPSSRGGTWSCTWDGFWNSSHQTSAVVRDTCTERRMILDRSEWRPPKRRWSCRSVASHSRPSRNEARSPVRPPSASGRRFADHRHPVWQTASDCPTRGTARPARTFCGARCANRGEGVVKPIFRKRR